MGHADESDTERQKGTGRIKQIVKFLFKDENAKDEGDHDIHGGPCSDGNGQSGIANAVNTTTRGRDPKQTRQNPPIGPSDLLS